MIIITVIINGDYNDFRLVRKV